LMDLPYCALLAGYEAEAAVAGLGEVAGLVAEREVADFDESESAEAVGLCVVEIFSFI